MKKEITLPTDMLKRFIADNEKDLAEYEASGNTLMAGFAKGRISVYTNLLEVWATE